MLRAQMLQQCTVAVGLVSEVVTGSAGRICVEVFISASAK